MNNFTNKESPIDHLKRAGEMVREIIDDLEKLEPQSALMMANRLEVYLETVIKKERDERTRKQGIYRK